MPRKLFNMCCMSYFDHVCNCGVSIQNAADMLIHSSDDMMHNLYEETRSKYVATPYLLSVNTAADCGTDMGITVSYGERCKERCAVLKGSPPDLHNFAR